MSQHQQLINEAAKEIARIEGWQAPEDYDFVMEATRPAPRGRVDRNGARTRRFLAMAEHAFRAITGDRPDYCDDEKTVLAERIAWNYITDKLPDDEVTVLVAFNASGQPAGAFLQEGVWRYDNGGDEIRSVYAWADFPSIPPAKKGRK